MTIIDRTDDLAGLCQRLSEADFVTVDTEFMREKTYWPKLCLVQLGGPNEAMAVDPLAEGMDLGPLVELLADKNILKVFHAARQDVEIFYHLSGNIPTPLFDTQVAAMVCGFGESVGYETLVSKLARARVDKSSRFTDWSRRPLSDRQVQYAIGDVTHLRVIYEKLAKSLENSGRSGWLQAEMEVLTAPATYALHPEDAWRRIKARSAKPKMLAILREVAAWREEQAQSRDIPRNRVLRDEALLEISADPPQQTENLERVRGIPRGFSSSSGAKSLMEAINKGLAIPRDQHPTARKHEPLPRGIAPLVDLLKVLLKAKCEESDVAQKLVANTSDLERIAVDDQPDVAALSGWRREIFGNDALALKRGEIALAADGGKIQTVPVKQDIAVSG